MVRSLAPRARRADGGLAWLVGFALPIDYLPGVPTRVLEVVRLVGLAALCLRHRSSISAPVARWVTVLAALMGSLAALRLAFTVPREPVSPAISFFVITVVSLTLAVLVGRRVAAHRSLLRGYLGGVTLSAVVSVLQAAGVVGARVPFVGPDRHPALAATTPQLSWQLALAIVIGLGLAATTTTPRARAVGLAQVVVCALAILVCGSQGGLVGLGLALVVVVGFGWRHLDRRQATTLVVASIVAVAVVAGLLALTSLGAPSLQALAGDPDKGFANESARIDAAEAGWRELVAHPATGVGQLTYDATYPTVPHLLPLSASVTTGVLGFLVGSALVGLLFLTVARGPVGRRPSAWVGLALLSVMCVFSLVTPSGPFLDITATPLLFVAVVAARGQGWPGEREAVVGPDDVALLDQVETTG